MIVVRIELWSAITGEKTKLAEMKIGNVTDDDSPHKGYNVCDYKGWVMRKPDFQKVTREGIVKGHRRNDLTVWHLLAKMLKNMGYV